MTVTERDLFAARALAVRAHEGQFRRDGVTPYIVHPRRVAARMSKHDLVGQCVAWLHDVPEDTNVTQFEIEGLFPYEIALPVWYMTKKKDQEYMSYLDCIKYKAPDVTRRVKIADILENLSDEPTQNQVRKYAKGLVHLTTKNWREC